MGFIAEIGPDLLVSSVGLVWFRHCILVLCMWALQQRWGEK
jgi:hypothetical protein